MLHLEVEDDRLLYWLVNSSENSFVFICSKISRILSLFRSDGTKEHFYLWRKHDPRKCFLMSSIYFHALVCHFIFWTRLNCYLYLSEKSLLFFSDEWTAEPRLSLSLFVYGALDARLTCANTCSNWRRFNKVLELNRCEVRVAKTGEHFRSPARERHNSPCRTLFSRFSPFRDTSERWSVPLWWRVFFAGAIMQILDRWLIFMVIRTGWSSRSILFR